MRVAMRSAWRCAICAGLGRMALWVSALAGTLAMVAKAAMRVRASRLGRSVGSFMRDA